MTLAVLVASGTLLFWLGILALRWLKVAPSTESTATRSLFAAAGLSGSYVGGGFPIVWAIIRNLSTWAETGSTSFTFAGNLPPGVDEDDLLVFLVIGMGILIAQATAEAWRALQ